jgi:methionine salvage enolase-phosphatase E1
VSFLKTKLSVVFKPFEWAWSVPPLSWVKPPLLKYLRKKASKALNENWEKELKKMDWPSTHPKKNETSQKDLSDPFALWEELIIQLAYAYDEKEITMEEVASFLRPDQALTDLTQMKMQNENLPDEIKTVMKKIEEQRGEIKQNQKIQSLMQNWTQKAEPNLKAQKMMKEYAEHQKKVFKQMVAQSPEIVENLAPDAFESQKDHRPLIGPASPAA